MTKLTTHVLDVYSGKPAAGIKIDVYYYDDQNQITKINSIILNIDGRCDTPLVQGKNFKEGKYELIFYVGTYFQKIADLPKTLFLDDIVLKFGVSDSSQNYHIPLLVSPWSYSTYRGS